MRGIVVLTDSEAMPAFERALLEARHGFTVIPAVVGSGRTGFKTGDRVHPGSTSLLFVMVKDAEREAVEVLLQRVRDESGVADATRLYSFAAEELGQRSPGPRRPDAAR
jgi:hypothetical protein